jgi:hypothetical protein
MNTDFEGGNPYLGCFFTLFFFVTMGAHRYNKITLTGCARMTRVIWLSDAEAILIQLMRFHYEFNVHR